MSGICGAADSELPYVTAAQLKLDCCIPLRYLQNAYKFIAGLERHH